MFQANDDFKVTAYSDLDWGACLDTRSLTGCGVFLGSALIAWKSKKQATVSRSFAEVEYHVLASTIAEILWITYFLKDFQVVCQQPIILYCDNQSSIKIVENQVFHKRTKHVGINCHFHAVSLSI